MTRRNGARWRWLLREGALLAGPVCALAGCAPILHHDSAPDTLIAPEAIRLADDIPPRANENK